MLSSSSIIIFCRLYQNEKHHSKPPKLYIYLPALFETKSMNFKTVKMGVGQKTMFFTSDRQENFFSMSRTKYNIRIKGKVFY